MSFAVTQHTYIPLAETGLAGSIAKNESLQTLAGPFLTTDSEGETLITLEGIKRVNMKISHIYQKNRRALKANKLASKKSSAAYEALMTKYHEVESTHVTVAINAQLQKKVDEFKEKVPTLEEHIKKLQAKISQIAHEAQQNTTELEQRRGIMDKAAPVMLRMKERIGVLEIENAQLKAQLGNEHSGTSS